MSDVLGGDSSRTPSEITHRTVMHLNDAHVAHSLECQNGYGQSGPEVQGFRDLGHRKPTVITEDSTLRDKEPSNGSGAVADQFWIVVEH